MAIAGLVTQINTDLDSVNGVMTVDANGIIRKVYPVYSTFSPQNTLKKWIDGKVVYERVGEVILATSTNLVSLTSVIPTNAKLLGIRFINRATNSISTNVLEYDSNTQVLVLGTAGFMTVFHPAGTYDLIVEYIKS